MPLIPPQAVFTPAREPLTIIRGQTWAALIKLYTDEAHTHGFDTTGWALTLTIGGTPLALTNGEGLTASGNEVMPELTEEQTGAVTVAESHYVLSAKKSGAKGYALRGTITWEDP